MESTPEDILHLVFEAYVHELGCSPVSLLTVSRRWYTILLSTRTIWSRVPIYITSYETIPFILGNRNSFSGGDSWAPLSAYLSRSYRPGDPVTGPLDIYIKWCRSRREADAIALRGHLLFTVSETERLETQLSELLLHLAGAEDKTEVNSLPNGPIMNGEGFRLCRWGSLKLDMSEFGCECCQIASTGFDLLIRNGCKSLPLLESLLTYNIDLFLNGLRMPRLRTLEMHNCAVASFSDLPSLESLTMINSKLEENDQFEIPNWSECTNLRQLQLSESRIWSIPADNPFPNLNVLLFSTSIPPIIMDYLERRFTQERPLEVLALAETSFYGLFYRFRSAPNFHTQILRLSARQFLGHNGHEDWGWDVFGHVRWNYNDDEMYMVRGFITLMRERRIRLEAMDAQMQAMLDFAQDEASIMEVQL